MAKKTKYKGVYYNETKQRYFYATRIKQDDGSYKSIRGKSTFTNPLLCLAALNQLKSQSINNQTSKTINTSTKRSNSQRITKQQDPCKVYNEFSLQYVCESFLNAYKLKNRESSFYSLNIIVCNYIYQYFGANLPFKQLCNDATLIKFKKYISDCSICINRKNKVLGTLKLIAERAFYMGIINQIELGLFKLNLDSLKESNIIKKSLHKKEFYTIEEFEKYKSVIDDENWKLAFEVLFYGGFRISEFLGITVNDLNSLDYSISINKQWDSKNKKFAPVKNSNGVRKTIINKDVFKRLIKFLEDNNLKNNNRIFCFSKTSMARKNNSFQEKAKLDHIKLHGFRHSCCSYLFQTYLKNNLVPNFEFIAKQLGDSVDMVQKVYMHMYQSESDKMIELL